MLLAVTGDVTGVVTDVVVVTGGVLVTDVVLVVVGVVDVLAAAGVAGGEVIGVVEVAGGFVVSSEKEHHPIERVFSANKPWLVSLPVGRSLSLLVWGNGEKSAV